MGAVISPVIIAAAAVLASPYLARLTLTAPDADDHAWWRGRAEPTRRRLLATAVVALVLGVLAGLASGLSLLIFAFMLLVLTGTPLVIIDFERHRLPNRLVFTLAIGAPLLALIPAAGHWGQYGRAAAGAAAVLAVLFALAFAKPAAFGYGDVKLGGVLGGYLGWFGWAQVYYGIFAGFVVGSLYALGLIALRRAAMKSHVPFGPALITGALVILAFGLVPSAA